MNYTKKQHFVSQYILKRFLNEKNKIDAVLIKENGIMRVSTNVKDICAERDFYEDKDSEGRYIERNRTENIFANIENELAKKVDTLIKLLRNADAPQQMKYLVKSGEWESISVWLMLHLTLVMIRLPKFKGIIFEKSELPIEVKQMFYKQMIFGNNEAERLAGNLFKGTNLDIIQNVIRQEENSGCINILMNHLVNNYYIEIYKAPENKKYYLTDDPAIINDISNIDYFLPLSPFVAMALKKITDENFAIQLIPEATTRMVDSLNSYLIQRAERIIIVKDMTEEDYDFIVEQRIKT